MDTTRGCRLCQSQVSAASNLGLGFGSGVLDLGLLGHIFGKQLCMALKSMATSVSLLTSGHMCEEVDGALIQVKGP